MLVYHFIALFGSSFPSMSSTLLVVKSPSLGVYKFVLCTTTIILYNSCYFGPIISLVILALPSIPPVISPYKVKLRNQHDYITLYIVHHLAYAYCYSQNLPYVLLYTDMCYYTRVR